MAALLDLVEGLRDELTNSDPEIRAKALAKLNNELKLVNWGDTSEGQYVILVQFYQGKISDDRIVVMQALIGLTVLVNERRLVKATHIAVPIAQAFFSNVSAPKDLAPKDRYHIYAILGILLRYHMSDLKSMGSDFVLGFVQFFDGEKDPRNLLLGFQLFVTVVQNFDIGPHGEDLFDGVACYFPIEFNPPSNDPYGITKEELSDAVIRCLTAHPSFCDPCLQLVLEKIDPTDPQRDEEAATKLLIASLRSFAFDQYVSDVPSLWDELRRQLLSPMATPTSKASIYDCLAELTTVYDRNAKDEAQFFHFLDKMYDDCEPLLQNLAIGLVSQAHQVLLTVAKTLERSYNRLIVKVLPGLIDCCKLVAPLEQAIKIDETKEIYLQAIADWLEHAPHAPSDQKLSHSWSTLLEYSLALRGAYNSVDETGSGDHIPVTQTGVQISALRIATSLYQQPVGLALDEADIRHWVAFGLRLLPHTATNNCRISVANSMVSLMKLLPTSESSYAADTLIDACLRGSGNIFTTNIINPMVSRFSDIPLCFTRNVVERLEELANVDSVARLCQRLLTEVEASFADDAICLVLPDCSINVPVPMGEAESGSGTAVEKRIEIASRILPLISDHLIQTKGLSLALEALTNYTACTSDGAEVECLSCQAYRRIVAIITDRIDDENALLLLDQSRLLLDKCALQWRRYRLHCYLTLGLLLRSHSRAMDWFKSLLNDMNDPSSCSSVAEALPLLLEDDSTVFSPQLRCRIDFLAQQRIKLSLMSGLLDGFSTTPAECRPAYLTALGSLLSGEFAQDSAVSERLYPIVLEAMEMPSVPEKLLSTFVILLAAEDFRTLVGSRLSTIVDNLLAIADDKSAFIDKRIQALKCIRHIALKMAPRDLILFQKSILRQIQAMVTDNKRLIRREAAEARNGWYLIGTS